jgi:AcrR family transcriptional regulator
MARMSGNRQGKKQRRPAPHAPAYARKADVNLARGGPGFASSAETRTAIMDAAEALFSQLGFEGVSIRSINAAVGLAPAAVHYHFGSKDGLLVAILRRRGEVALRRSNELLDALAMSGRTPTASDIINVTAIPCREMIERDPVGGLRWIRLFAHLLIARNPRVRRYALATRELQARVWHVTCQAFPGTPHDVLALGSRLAMHTFYQMLSYVDVTAAESETEATMSGAYLSAVTDFVASGFAAVMVAGQQSNLDREVCSSAAIMPPPPLHPPLASPVRSQKSP